MTGCKPALTFTFNHRAEALYQNRISFIYGLKGQFTQKWKVCYLLMLYTLSHVVPNLFNFVLWNIKKTFWRMLVSKKFQFPLIFIEFHRTEKYNTSRWKLKLFAFQHSNILLFFVPKEERNAYRFGRTRGWVIDRIFIFGWTFRLSSTFVEEKTFFHKKTKNKYLLWKVLDPFDCHCMDKNTLNILQNVRLYVAQKNHLFKTI